MRRLLHVGAAVAAAPAAVRALLTLSAPPTSQTWAWYCDARASRGRSLGYRRPRSNPRVQSPPVLLESRNGGATLTVLSAQSSGEPDVNDVPDRNVGGAAERPPLQHIPPSALVVRDEATGCDIYLVGCLHGSHASGRDVQTVLDRVRPGAVVLELCESRHKSLRRDIDKGAGGDVSADNKEGWQEVFREWSKGIQTTSKKAGVLQALLAGLLSAPYVVQRLGDFDPGLEFKTAMVYADASRSDQSTPDMSAQFRKEAGPGIGDGTSFGGGECAVVLGDRDVQETLRRLGGALTALTSRRDGSNGSEGYGGAVDEQRLGGMAGDGGVGVLGTSGVGEVDASSSTIFSDARVLRMAIVGPAGTEWPESLNVFDTVWRERQALAGLLLPLLFVSSVVSELLQRSVRGAASAAVSVSGASSSDSGGGIGVLGGGGHAGMDLGRLLETAGDVFDTAFVAWSVWYMLRFFRLVIKERDDVLASSILKTCRDYPERPVVAVLGLLHCNGVADIIRSSVAPKA